MSPTADCPDESVLLALAAEDAAAPAVRSHIAACPVCRRTLKRLKAEVVELRSTIDPDGEFRPTAPKDD